MGLINKLYTDCSNNFFFETLCKLLRCCAKCSSGRPILTISTGGRLEAPAVTLDCYMDSRFQVCKVAPSHYTCHKTDKDTLHFCVWGFVKRYV